VLLSSGIAKLVSEFISITPIGEGDQIVLALQTARYLVRCWGDAASGRKASLDGDVAYLGSDR
jgi:hypothetical protein